MPGEGGGPEGGHPHRIPLRSNCGRRQMKRAGRLADRNGQRRQSYPGSWPVPATKRAFTGVSWDSA